MAATKKTTSKKTTSKKATSKKAASKKAASKKVTAKKKAAKKGKKIAATSAAAILGLTPPKRAVKKTVTKVKKPINKIRIKAEWKKYYDILQDLRGRLTHQMDDLKKESAEEMSSYSMHMADSGTDNFDRDSALSLLSSDQDAVYEIDEALKRIEKKTYGVCELTGKNITKTRLTAVPWARYTVEAQAQLEKDGAVRQRNKLGSLGTIDGAGSNKTALAGSAETETKTTK